jgi:hypothetical protein
MNNLSLLILAGLRFTILVVSIPFAFIIAAIVVDELINRKHPRETLDKFSMGETNNPHIRFGRGGIPSLDDLGYNLLFVFIFICVVIFVQILCFGVPLKSN